MIDDLNFILAIINYDIVIGFLYYSIVFFIVFPFFKNKSNLKYFDNYTCKVVIYSSIIYAILLILKLILQFYQLETGLEKQNYINSFFSNWYAFLLEITIPLFFIQLLRFKQIKRYLFFRTLIVLVFTFSIEKVAVFIAAYNSYSAWNDFGFIKQSIFESYNAPVSAIIISILLRVITFVFFILIFVFFEKQFKKKPSKI